MIKKVEFELGGKTIGIETGRVSNQANGSVLVTCGDTVVLATATMSSEPREDIDFFPLTCDYEERLYAAGKIPGGFVKRGGRPSEKAVLTSRVIDRPLRPLFPDGLRNEVQIIAMPLSVEPENPSDVLAMLASSAAIAVSDIPFEQTIATVRVCRVEGELVINPTLEQIAASDFEMILAGTSEKVMTIEVEAHEVPEDEVLAAIDFGMEHVRKAVAAIDELAAKVGVTKADVKLHKVPQEILDAVKEDAQDEIRAAIQNKDKASRENAISELKEQIIERMLEKFPENEIELSEAVEKVIKQQVRSLVLEEGIRPDGRGIDDIRPVSSEVGLLPRVHGSGLFQRGQTQVLTALTLGSLDDAQIIDTLEEDGEKRFMHFYNFPPYSTGEVKPLRAAGRREIGHGALAEKALRPVIPEQSEFPYSLLLTSEVLGSNGSSSMASTCGCTLALMDAGVKIKSPVAGISIGMMSDENKKVLLTDIQGMEDFTGDMDFKITGSAKGITAIQVDVKIDGLDKEVITGAFQKAREARLKILDVMLQAIPEPRESLSIHAPRVFIVVIHPDKIGEVIGPGGKVIKKIEAETGAKISIEQDGHVYITCVDAAGGERAKKMVEDITREVRVGETYVGKVNRIERYGAFLEILPGRDGLAHISELAEGRVERTEDVLSMGQELPVKVIGIDDDGKIKLSVIRALTDRGEAPESAALRERESGRGGGGRLKSGSGGGRKERGDWSERGGPTARFRPKR